MLCNTDMHHQYHMWHTIMLFSDISEYKDSGLVDLHQTEEEKCRGTKCKVNSLIQ